MPTAWRVTLSAAVLVVAGLLAYANATSGPFFLDDLETVTTNEQIRHLRPVSALLTPERELPVAGRPLVNISFALNYAIGGFDVRGYHLVNIALHIACALVLFGVVRRTADMSLALAAALLWLVHPLQTEAVNYVTERTELMVGLFYLLTIYASVRAYERSRWQLAAVLACLLGMACKESMVTAPLMVVLFDRVFLYRSFGEAWRQRWRLYVGLAATWTLLAVLLASGPRALSAGFGTGISPWTYLLNQAVLIVRYLRLSVWPSGLVVMYGVPRALTVSQVVPELVFLSALGVLTLAMFRYSPRLAFLGVWFFVTLAPSSSIVPIATEVGAERRMYLPLVAIVVLGVVAIARVVGNRAFPAVIGLIAVGLTTGTVIRNREYASTVSLAQTVMERWPTPRAQHWLGAELLAAGRHDEGFAQLRAALPGEPRTHYTLGMALFNDGHMDEAIDHLRAFIVAEPLRIEVPAAHETLGRALDGQGKSVEAAAEFRTLIAMQPSNVEAHGLLADALLKQQKYDEAIAEYQEFLRRRPGEVNALMNLGIAFASLNRSADAIAAFGRAVEADPRHPSARRNLALALLDAGRFADALPHAQAAVSLAPNDPVVHDELGVALAGLKRYQDAIDSFERSLRLNPNDPEVQAHLAQALRAKDAIIANR